LFKHFVNYQHKTAGQSLDSQTTKTHQNTKQHQTKQPNKQPKHKKTLILKGFFATSHQANTKKPLWHKENLQTHNTKQSNYGSNNSLFCKKRSL
jgi:hypothetical protein